MDFSRDDVEVFAEYGRAMLAAQMFELRLIQLVHLQQPDPPDDAPLEEAWKILEKVWKWPAKERARRLDVDDDLADELGTAINTRNTLAHEYLLTYGMKKAAGEVTPSEAATELRNIAQKFSATGEFLSQHSDPLLRARGIDPDEGPVIADQWRLLFDDQ